jgi:hypothetical protein
MERRLAGKVYNFKNFCASTIGNFIICSIPNRPPDYTSDSGSVYWNAGDTVERSLGRLQYVLLAIMVSEWRNRIVRILSV